MKKLINVEIWKDFYDEEWRIKVIFWKYEVARFRITMKERSTFSGIKIEPSIERLPDNKY